MQFEQKNFFETSISQKFAGICTDPPYKGCIDGKLEEQTFDVAAFMKKCNEITQPDAFLIVFTNFAMSYDLREFAKQNGWKFAGYQIWDKSPCRTWIAWSLPLRTCEFILYFTKGTFKFCFKNGEIHEKVNRKHFGGSLKETSENQNKVSYGMFEEIIRISGNIKNRIHPTEKPAEFSKMFYQITQSTEQSFVCDPFCGSGNLLSSFKNSIGYDIKNWRE
jgi:DNA modification methylase